MVVDMSVPLPSNPNCPFRNTGKNISRYSVRRKPNQRRVGLAHGMQALIVIIGMAIPLLISGTGQKSFISEGQMFLVSGLWAVQSFTTQLPDQRIKPCELTIATFALGAVCVALFLTCSFLDMHMYSRALAWWSIISIGLAALAHGATAFALDDATERGHPCAGIEKTP